MARDPQTGLTDQQRQFCEVYLQSFNAAASYLSVYGCKPKAAESAAARLLRDVRIQAYLSRLRQETSRRAEVTLERTLQEISRVAFSNITHALDFAPGGLTLKDSAQLPDDVTAAIESVVVNEVQTKDGVSRRQSVKLHSKMAALGFLADYFGLRDDFNQARATLKRYGLAMVEDATSEAGWVLRRLEQ